MKKTFLLTASLALFLLSACRKDRVCTCTVPATGTTPEQKFTEKLDNTKKKEAKNSCSLSNDKYKQAGGKCELE